MRTNWVVKIALIILLLGLTLRLWKIDIPLLEFYPSRQIQTAEITRNLYEGKGSFFDPTVNYLGPKPVTYLAELPIYNSFVALLYKLNGSVNESLGRFVSIFGWVVSFFFLYLISKKYLGSVGIVTTLFFYTFSPLSILVSRSFQPDEWMLALSMVSIYLIDVKFFISAVFASLAILFKFPSVVFIIVPVLLYMIEKKIAFKLRLLLYLAIALLPSLIWYIYAVIIGKSGQALSNASTVSNWFSFDVLVSPKFYSNVFGFESNLVLLPIGLLFFVTGFLTKLQRHQYFLYWWIAGVVSYFLIFNKHNMTHEYYHLPILPIAAIFIGMSCERIFEKYNGTIIPKNILLFLLAVLTIVTMLPTTIARSYKPIGRFSYVLETAGKIRAHTNADDIIVGSIDAGPALVYYSNRPGWSFEIDKKNTQETLDFYGVDQNIQSASDDLESKRNLGAVIFASAYKPQFTDNKEFSDYMYTNYRILQETENYIIFDLTSSSLER